MHKLTIVACLAAHLTGCSQPSIETSHVLQLEVCPEQSEDCSTTPPADGRSTVDVQVCAKSDDVKSGDRRTDLVAILTATRGTWAGHSAGDPTTVEVQLQSSICRVATLTVDQVPGANRIEATLLGFTETTTIIAAPAALTHVDFTPATLPLLQGADPANVQLSVTATTDLGGMPSRGTRVKFSAVDVAPAGNVTLTPLVAMLDGDGAATLNVFVPPAVQSFTIVGEVTPPRDSSMPGAEPNSVQGTFDVKRQ